MVRRLWDSWEDDAIIRDVTTGRYVDTDKLHYIDFVGKYFSVKGPSITPRPPQGQPVVAALAHAGPVYEFAAASSRCRVHHSHRRRVAAKHPRRGSRRRAAGDLKVFADVLVSFDGDGDPRSDAFDFGGSPAELVDMLLDWQRLGIHGARLRPAVNATDLPVIVDQVVPLLQRAGRFRTGTGTAKRCAHDWACPSRPTATQGGSVTTVPLSILDLAPISAGSDAATALRNTIDLASAPSSGDFARYWIAEHHFVGVASSAPAVLIGQIAAATNTIRVGAAAVQLGYTTAVAVVESFGMLDAFYPGRIDLGVGPVRAAPVRRAQTRRSRENPDRRGCGTRSTAWSIPTPFDLRGLLDLERLGPTMEILQQPEAVSPDFAEQLSDILALLDGTYHAGNSTCMRCPAKAAG